MAYIDNRPHHRSKWRAEIRVNNRAIYLGCYSTWELARAAEIKERIRYLQEELESLDLC